MTRGLADMSSRISPNNSDNLNGKRKRRQKATPPLLWWPLWARLTAFSMFIYLLFVLYFLLFIELPSSRIEHAVDTMHNHPGPNHIVAMHSMAAQQKVTGRTTTLFAPEGAYNLDREMAEATLKKLGAAALRKLLTAYLEPSMDVAVNNTGNQGDPTDDKDAGIPPDYIMPLSLRTKATPSQLLKYTYPKLQTCFDMPSKFPVDRGLHLDGDGKPIIWNLGDTPTNDNFPLEEAPYCPVDADPYLPWIHDVFPNINGTSIVVIAQNKRRCKTGRNFRKDVKRLEPQVSLLQPVSVARITEAEARTLAPDLWHPETSDDSTTLPRYRLAPFHESASDGQFTRFICRFHALDFSGGEEEVPRSMILGETLSTYPINYEYVAYRKKTSDSGMITAKGKDSKLFWAANLQFECPVPTFDGLSERISDSSAILSDGTPTIHVDVIPIRTPPRYGSRGEFYFREGMVQPQDMLSLTFDAKKQWGDRNVMPRVEASGRWVNVPICFPPYSGTNVVERTDAAAVALQRRRQEAKESQQLLPSKKPHMLSACLWASASFRTRGEHQSPITDTLTRLVEWIEFHLMVGFDHIYVYDNSGAHTNETSLAPVLDKYPASQVTRIDWPSMVCNNNIPAHDNTGERSSQYAAENSCRTRHAPFTEWIAAFDTDEYLIPMGHYTSLKNILADAQKQRTNILSFRSSRARLRFDSSQSDGAGRTMHSNATFLEAYNCDTAPLPKPTWADRARKQIYRADYVLYHFVHYSTVTRRTLETYAQDPRHWYRYFGERPPSERVTDEVNEAVMLHAKTTSQSQTANWIERCHYQFKKKWRGCYVGFPWHNGTATSTNDESSAHQPDGMEYNCFENDKITHYWGPRLREALARRHEEWTTSQ